MHNVENYLALRTPTQRRVAPPYEEAKPRAATGRVGPRAVEEKALRRQPERGEDVVDEGRAQDQQGEEQQGHGVGAGHRRLPPATPICLAARHGLRAVCIHGNAGLAG